VNARRQARPALAFSADGALAGCTLGAASIKFGVMAKLTVWSQFTTAVNDRQISGSWAIEDGMVKVRTPHGEKATLIGESDPIWLAARLACELAAERKA
jgi:hypothetical protein